MSLLTIFVCWIRSCFCLSTEKNDCKEGKSHIQRSKWMLFCVPHVILTHFCRCSKMNDTFSCHPLHTQHPIGTSKLWQLNIECANWWSSLFFVSSCSIDKSIDFGSMSAAWESCPRLLLHQTLFIWTALVFSSHTEWWHLTLKTIECLTWHFFHRLSTFNTSHAIHGETADTDRHTCQWRKQSKTGIVLWQLSLSAAQVTLSN